MEIYLLKFSACLAIFWLVYILFLERQNRHHFKRFYLLGALVLALLIPTLTITEYIEPIVANFETAQLFIPIEPSFIEMPIEEPPFFNLETTLWLIYGIGALLFLFRFTINLFNMYKRILNNETVFKRSFIYVLLEEYRIPHSFFKYIFFNRLSYENQTIPNEVMLHEETHAKQLHSLDILIIELLQIVFWFHPLVYILKHHIKLNHEFLADQAVLEQGTDTKVYQNILLQFSSNTQEYHLSSAINYSSIKKRFTVMKTQTSKTRIWVSTLLLLPIIAILFYSFSTKEYVEKENSKISEAIATELEKANDLQLIYKDGATEAMMKEYKDWIKRLNNNSSSLIIPIGTFERLVAIYDLMSEAQRNSVETHPFLQEMTPDLYSVEASTPTTAQFESWKNEKEFAIWLDNKHISNSELNNYKINDISHYTGSKVHENAKSKKFDQPFQFHLYTKDGFNKFYKEAFINDYRVLTKTYSSAINTYLKGSKTDNSELKILKSQADKLYNTFTKEELKKHNILPVPPVPAQNSEIIVVLINRNDEFLINDEKGSFESLEKLLKQLPKSDFTVSLKTDKETSSELTKKVLELFKKYNVFTSSEKQETNAIERTLNQNSVAKYIKKHKAYEALRNKEPHYIHKSKEDQQEMDALFSDLGGMYFRLSKENKAKVKRPISPVRPYVKITLNGKTYYKKYEELTAEEKATLPPPPPPPAKPEKSKSKGGPNNQHYPIPPPIPEDATPQERKKMQATIDAFEKKHKRKVHTIKDNETGVQYNMIVTDEVYEGEETQEKATVKQVAAYNAWAKKLNTAMAKAEASNDYANLIVKQKDVEKYKRIYMKLMSAEQRKNTEPFPSFPPPPPPPTKAKQYKNGKKLTLNEIIKQTPKGVKSGYELLENGESHYYTVHKGEKTYYNKDGFITDKKGKILPPPPPPPPAPHKNPSFLEYIEDMEKQGASFYLDGKKITANEAKAIAKNNKGKKTDMLTQKDKNGKYLVKLSKSENNSHSSVKSKKSKGGPNSNDLEYNYHSSSKSKQQYVENYKQYETMRYTKPHFLHKSKADKKEMNNLWLELRKHYIYKLSKTEQKSVKLPTAPRLPYIKINKDGKSYYKLYNQLTIEEEKTMMLSPKPSAGMIKTLELIDESYPIVIPIGTYTLEKKEAIKKTETKRSVYITISEDGIYSISKDNTFKNFEPVSLKTLESVIAKLSLDEIKNTFIFSKNKDYKKFRSKPAKSPEYQDDIEVYLVKDDIRFTTMEYNGKFREQPSYQMVLDNDASENLKSFVSKLADLFKKYGISNLTI